MVLEPGKSFDRYTVEALVGAGGMGEVYRAFDTRLQRHVALKVLHPPNDGEGRAAIVTALGEARAAAAIAHPNATATFDADEISGTSFIVMELVRGTSLRKLVGEFGVPLAVRIRWLVDIAGALAAAHQVGIVHRDIKPENVMIRDDGLVKVLDFGVARRTGFPDSIDEPEDRSWLSGGQLVGTPAYMAPELIRGEESDGRVDQFAWGVLGYELLTGRVPWSSSDSFLGCLAGIIGESPTPPSIFVKDLPIEVEAAILRAMAKAPEDRFGSMVEAAQELAPYAHRDAAISSIPPSLRQTRVPPGDPAADPTVAMGTPPFPKRSRDSVRPVTMGPQAAPNPVASPEKPSEEPPPTPRSGPVSVPFSRATGLSPRVPSTPAEPRFPFRDPDFLRPVDINEHLALVPKDATCKGMFFADILQRAASVTEPTEVTRAANLPDRRYIAFRDYPLSDGLCLAVAAAKLLYPGESLGEALRRIGQLVFATVLGSHVGRSVLGALQGDTEASLLSAPKAFKLLVNVGELSVEKIDLRTFFLHVRSFPAFLETLQIGVLEALLQHCQERARFRVHLDDLERGVVEIRLL